MARKYSGCVSKGLTGIPDVFSPSTSEDELGLTFDLHPDRSSASTSTTLGSHFREFPFYSTFRVAEILEGQGGGVRIWCPV